ncbi:MAG: mechanosensitive ion channel [Nitrosospira sp.]|nr:mechanosensitive ion channel [Nitrosospira sp.]
MSDLIGNLIVHPLFMKGVTAAFAMLLIILLVRFAQAAASRKIEDKDLRYKMRKAFSLAGYVLAPLAVLTIFSDQMTNLTVIIGALSVGIGFALREVIQSLIGWAVISFGKQYKPGDRIQIGSIMGDVIDISPLITTVMECGEWVKADLYNGRIVRLSNNLMFKEHIINYTADFPFLWDEIVIPVRTDSDHHLARSIIEGAGQTVLSKFSEESKEAWRNFVRHYRVEDAKLDPMVTMSFDSNFIEFTLRYVVDCRVRRSTKDKLFVNILAGFEETHGKVQIGSTTLQLAEIPPLSVQLQKEA